jgi:hypothetical protein
MSGSAFASMVARYWNDIESLRSYVQVTNPYSNQSNMEAIMAFLQAMLAQGAVHDAGSKEFSEAEALHGLIAAIPQTATAEGESTAEAEMDLRLFPLMGIRDPKLIEILQGLSKLQRVMPLLHGSVLVTLTSLFEVLFSDILHQFCRIHPAAFGSQAASLTLRELQEFASVDDAIHHLASQQIDKLLRGNMEGWRSFLKEPLGVELAEVPPSGWGNWQELHARRNLLVHNSGRANALYIKQFGSMKERSLSVGDQISLDSDYLRRAFDEFAVTGIRLIDLCWAKLIPGEGEMRDTTLMDLVFQSLLLGRWFLAEQLCSHVLKRGAATDSGRLIFTINRWLSLKRQGRWTEVEKQVRRFDTRACHPKFSVCVHSLREDAQAFFETVPLAGLDLVALMTWPVFEEMRKHPEFQEALDRLRRDN